MDYVLTKFAVNVVAQEMNLIIVDEVARMSITDAYRVSVRRADEPKQRARVVVVPSITEMRGSDVKDEIVEHVMQCFERAFPPEPHRAVDVRWSPYPWSPHA